MRVCECGIQRRFSQTSTDKAPFCEGASTRKRETKEVSGPERAVVNSPCTTSRSKSLLMSARTNSRGGVGVARPGSRATPGQRAPAGPRTPGSGRRPEDYNKKYAANSSPGSSPGKSETSNTSAMLDVKDNRKRAESDLQLLANRIALLRVEEQKAVNKVHETKKRSEEILL